MRFLLPSFSLLLSVMMVSACGATGDPDDVPEQGQPQPPADGAQPPADGGDDPAQYCEPGTSRSCYCLDGRAGTQRCLHDGSRWDSCLCEEPPGGGGDATAPSPEPPASSASLVTGSLFSDVRVVDVDRRGRIFLRNPEPYPATGSMLMVVLDGDGEVIGEGFHIDEQGEFAIPVQAPLTGDEIVLFIPALVMEDEVVMAVLEPRRDWDLRSTVNDLWAWYAEVGSDGSAGELYISEEDGAGAINLYYVNVAGLVSILSYLDTLTPSDLVSLAVLWAPGFAWECGACYGQRWTQRVVDSDLRFSDSVWIAGDEGDSGAWGYPVILHELGHYVAANYSRDDSPGGAHYHNEPLPPPFAWSEGWANFMAVMTVSLLVGEPSPLFWDIQEGGSFWTDYDAMIFDVEPMILPDPDGDTLQYIIEDYVTSVLWHLWIGDDVADPGEIYPVALGTRRVVDGITSRRFIDGDRGYLGADLVDFIDSVICANPRLTNAIESTVRQMQFPYDGVPTCAP